jgi:hypothetical protein
MQFEMHERKVDVGLIYIKKMILFHFCMHKIKNSLLEGIYKKKFFVINNNFYKNKTNCLFYVQPWFCIFNCIHFFAIDRPI